MMSTLQPMNMELNSDKEYAKEKGRPSFLLNSGDLPVERAQLLAQMQVLDCMLNHIENEEQQRAKAEGALVSDASANDTTPSFTNFSDGTNFKRQRRPNPKYFDTEIEATFPPPGSSPSTTFCSYDEELAASLGFPDGQPLYIAGNAEAFAIAPSVPHATLSSCFDCCMVRPAGTHGTCTALAQKPSVFSTSEGTLVSTDAEKSDSYLDNLSIRELHEAFRNTFGKDTSVKDKHWLKRQIFMGSSKHSGGKENRGNPALRGTNGRRGGQYSSAHTELYDFERTDVHGGIERGMGTSTTLLSCSFSSKTKRSCKTLELGVLTSSSLSTLPTSWGCQTNTGVSNKELNLNEVQNMISSIDGKRLRKPNRRYIEDEGDGNKLHPGPARLSWRSETELVGDGKRNGAVRTGTRASTRSNSCHRGRSKNGIVMKKKNEGQASKLLKLAQSAQVRHVADGKLRKVKFRLPAAPDQEKVELLVGGSDEQVSCVLPELADGFSEDCNMLYSHYLSTSEATTEQAAVTVLTGNSGTRRKHHRPWTLREVVTLVEGVAQCGGGKWAEIKKRGFSTVSYRTAVDLKDKWRNLLRASRAQLYPLKQGDTRKKQFSASVPDHILARVQELAALNNQTIPTTNFVNSSSRSGRPIQRR